MAADNTDRKTQSAKDIVKEYLDKRASEDELFAKSYTKPQKSLDECWRYIVGEARRRAQGNCACISDAEVYGLAVHYYDEDDIKVHTAGPVRVSTGTDQPKPTVKLTEKEKAAAKEEAKRLYSEAVLEELRAKAKAKKKKSKPASMETQQTPSLFDGIEF